MFWFAKRVQVTPKQVEDLTTLLKNVLNRIDEVERRLRSLHNDHDLLEGQFVSLRQTVAGRLTRNPGGKGKHSADDLTDPSLSKDDLRRRLNLKPRE